MICLNLQEVLANSELRALDGISIGLIHGTGQSHNCDLGSIQLNALPRRIGIKMIENSAGFSYYGKIKTVDLMAEEIKV